MLERFWHGFLKQPYKLHKRIDEGQGVPVVLLHGIGRSGAVWSALRQLLVMDYRVVAFDLLGFGDSPKPELMYNIDDHAKPVIAAIKKLHQPVVLVGHSMGALVALRVARLRPDLVRHVVLYEMPLYEGLPDKRIYKTRLAAYFNFYKWVTRQDFGFEEAAQTFYEKIALKVVGSDLSAETWQPFVRSLQNTIMDQTAPEDLAALDVPADVIFGSRDMLVFKGQVKERIDTNLVGPIETHVVKAPHRITPGAAEFIAQRIHAACG